MSDARLAAAAKELLAAHRGARPLLLPNVWDAASAKIVAEAGFPVVATSSRAIAQVLGEPDDDTTPAGEIFAFVARIARAVDCPVTADLEAGYGLSPAALVQHMLGAGVVGCNLEDTDHHGEGVLLDAARQADFLADVRAEAEREGIHLVFNARVDVFVRHVGEGEEQFQEALRRARLYLEAGADCIYPIFLSDPVLIGRLVEALGGALNILARRDGPSIDELATLGVRRISLASGLHQFALEQLRTAVGAFAAAPSWSSLTHGG